MSTSRTSSNQPVFRIGIEQLGQCWLTSQPQDRIVDIIHKNSRLDTYEFTCFQRFAAVLKK
jgi:hypothetical protein